MGRRTDRGNALKYIKDIVEGDNIKEVYMCRMKKSCVSKMGKPYESVTLQDKTGSIDAKIWDPGNAGIEEFGEMDYVEVYGEVITFMKHLQLNIRRARKVKPEAVNPEEYVPVSGKNIGQMYQDLVAIADTVQEEHLHRLLELLFKEDQAFIAAFRRSSAAKTVHHSYMGGLLEHTLNVTRLCVAYADQYTFLNRDLLLTAAICHDIGKTRELSGFPQNDYTDEGQLLGHIIIGVEILQDKLRLIPDFPETLSYELIHCILAHHGELEYGSPKKPAIAEAAVLNFADNADAKLEIFRQLFESKNDSEWLGFQSFLDSNIRRTTVR